jgi:hypothetical protein
MATEILRPDAAGDETNIGGQYPNSTYHWDKVDEVSADDSTTCVYSADYNVYRRDLYALPAPTGSGTISKITVFVRCMQTNTGAP